MAGVVHSIGCNHKSTIIRRSKNIRMPISQENEEVGGMSKSGKKSLKKPLINLAYPHSLPLLRKNLIPYFILTFSVFCRFFTRKGGFQGRT